MDESEWIKLKVKLAESKFRSEIKFSEKDRQYYLQMSAGKIREHAQDFIAKRLALAQPENDGKQTPWRGHPVFTAQHATATCCRRCLFKWHKIDKGKELDKSEIEYIVRAIMDWLAGHNY